MENQNNQVNEINIIKKPKSKFWKFTRLFFATIAGVFILYLAGAWGWYFFRQWQGEKRVENLVNALKQAEADDYAKAMADTYGGKIPQETLQMYISAVEKGDYELASKYFVINKQEQELNYLRLLDNNKFNWFLEKMLKKALTQSVENKIIDEKNYWINVKSEEANIYYSEIKFFKYPNNIWKIDKIFPENF